MIQEPLIMHREYKECPYSTESQNHRVMSLEETSKFIKCNLMP